MHVRARARLLGYLGRRRIEGEDPGHHVWRQLLQFDLQRAAGALAAHARVEDRAQSADDRAGHRLGDRALAWGLLEHGDEERGQKLGVARPALDARPGRRRPSPPISSAPRPGGRWRLRTARARSRRSVRSIRPPGRTPRRSARSAADQLVVGRQQALLLVLEVLVEAAPRDAGAGDQVGDRGGDEAALVDRLDRGLVQALALVGRDLLRRQRLRAARQAPPVRGLDDLDLGTIPIP